jgi:serine protease Do
MDVVLDELAEPEPVRAAPSAPPGSLGISVADLTPELTRRLGLPRVEPGVVVIKIEPGSLADEVGLRAGDVIHEVNRQPVRSPRDFRDAVDRAKGKSLALLVNRRGVMAYVVIERAG